MTYPEMTQSAAPVSNPDAVRTRGLLRLGSSTLGLNALVVGLNLLTGIVTARALGVTGRGQLTAIVIPPQLIGWVFAMGCFQAASYHVARHPGDGGRLIATWVLMLLPLSLMALVSGEAFVHLYLGAQTSFTVRLAELYMLTVVMVLVSELMYGVLLGDHDFLFVNLLRVAQPAASAAAYLFLWWLHRLTVETALLALAGPALVALMIAVYRAIGRYGIRRPDWALGRSTLWYGIRAHGTNVSDLLNSRLDLMIIPALLGASSVGLYAVATTVSELVFALSGALTLLVLPLAARHRAEGARTVIRLTQATFVVGVLLTLTIAVLAKFAIRLVYGSAFESSAVLVLILLPGTVLYATAGVLRPALYAENRPLAAAGSYALGAVVTVPGLLLFLRPGGLIAAAIVSSVSYGAVFLATLVAYRQVTGVPLRRFTRWG